MNKFYKGINILLTLRNILIAAGIILAVFSNKVGLMMCLELGANSALVQWFILFMLFLLEFILYLHNAIAKKVFVFSIVVMFVDFYLTYKEMSDAMTVFLLDSKRAKKIRGEDDYNNIYMPINFLALAI